MPQATLKTLAVPQHPHSFVVRGTVKTPKRLHRVRARAEGVLLTDALAFRPAA